MSGRCRWEDDDWCDGIHGCPFAQYPVELRPYRCASVSEARRRARDRIAELRGIEPEDVIGD